MLESKVYAEFRKYVMHVFDVDRIENAIQSGMFDCVLSAANRTMWVEFKKNEEAKLRGTQVGWVLRRHKAGCFNDMMVVTLVQGVFILASAVHMAKMDLKMSEAARVLVMPDALTDFMLQAILTGERHDQRSGTGEGTGDTSGQGSTRH